MKEIKYGPLTIKGDVVVGDWEGDPGVDGGVHYLDPYVDWIEVWVGYVNITDYLLEEQLDAFEEALLEANND